jgi:hypothetical protein
MNSMAVVRISLGRFDPENFEIIRALLDDSQTTLIPAIQKLSGNLGYYVGIDRENNAMTNVSIWQSLGDAQQMATLPEMMALAKTFIDAGVRFERPITNHQTRWEL